MSDLSSSSAPARRSGTSVRELTFRGIILGGLMTLIFTAANVYLGLKVGLTFATSIPAAVISMAVLRHFKGHSVEENIDVMCDSWICAALFDVEWPGCTACRMSQDVDHER